MFQGQLWTDSRSTTLVDITRANFHVTTPFLRKVVVITVLHASDQEIGVQNDER